MVSTGENMRKEEPSHTTGGSVKVHQFGEHLGKLAAPQKGEHRVTIEASKSTPKYIPEKEKHTHTRPQRAHSVTGSVIQNIQRVERTQLSTY